MSLVRKEEERGTSVPSPPQTWRPWFCARGRALAAFPALELLSPAHATAGGGVDGASMGAVVLVPGRRLLAADLHDDGGRVLRGHGA